MVSCGVRHAAFAALSCQVRGERANAGPAPVILLVSQPVAPVGEQFAEHPHDAVHLRQEGFGHHHPRVGASRALERCAKQPDASVENRSRQRVGTDRHHASSPPSPGRRLGMADKEGAPTVSIGAPRKGDGGMEERGRKCHPRSESSCSRRSLPPARCISVTSLPAHRAAPPLVTR